MKRKLASLLTAALLGACGMTAQAQTPIADALGLPPAAPPAAAASADAPVCLSSGFGQNGGCCDSCCDPWTGFYVGGQVGWGWNRPTTTANLNTPGVHPTPPEEPARRDPFSALSPTTVSLNPDGSGFLGGLNAGYDRQFGFLVVGVLTDFTWTGMSGSASTPWSMESPGGTTGGTVSVHQNIDWFGTVRGRVGVAFDRVLIYATGGLAYGNVNSSGNATDSVAGFTTSYPASVTRTQVGWTVGAGLEYRISRSWSWKVEYLYLDLGSESATGSSTNPSVPGSVHYDWETRAHVLLTGLTYRF